MNYKISKPYVYWVDFIRMFAVFQVVIIHVSAGLLYSWGKISVSTWMVGNVYDSFSRISVPLLFMISGALLLNRDEPLIDFFIKRFSKLGVPFVFWSLFYLYWRCIVNGQSCSLMIVYQLLFVDGSSYHLWFLYALVGVYLITPLLRILVFSGNKQALWYFVALWMFFEPGITLLDKVWGLQIGVNVPMVTGFAGFFILGYLLRETRFPSWVVILSFVVWGLSVLVTVLGTYFMTIYADKFVGFFYEYLSINVILASVSAYILLKQLAEYEFKYNVVVINSVKKIADTSFGIYLVHILILDIMLNHIPLLHLRAIITENPAWGILMVSTIIFTISFYIVSFVKKIPVINRVV